MNFTDAAIMLLAEQKHKAISSAVLTNKQTGEIVPCTLNFSASKQQENAG